MGIYVGFGLSVMLLPSHIHTHTRNSPFFQFELRQPSPERDVLDVYIYIQHNYIEHEWNIMQHQRRSWAAELLRIAGGGGERQLFCAWIQTSKSLLPVVVFIFKCIRILHIKELKHNSTFLSTYVYTVYRPWAVGASYTTVEDLYKRQKTAESEVSLSM